ncbi:MAG: hypothetical protein V1763_03295 [Parcubacteria group bacterium]
MQDFIVTVALIPFNIAAIVIPIGVYAGMFAVAIIVLPARKLYALTRKEEEIGTGTK